MIIATAQPRAQTVIMKTLRRLSIAALFALGLSNAVAQAPPVVPALPDTPRLTSYTIAGTTCTCAVNFALYGNANLADYQDWVEVFLNGVQVAYNDPTYGWTITSPTGALASIARPVTDAVLTFTNVQTGTVEIVGASRPARLSQWSENQGVSARNLNVAFTGIVAQLREVWDKINDVSGRDLKSQPGNTVGLLPLPAACSNAFLGFDATGLNPLCRVGAGSGNVVGPATSTVNHLAAFGNVTGSALLDIALGTHLSIGSSTLSTDATGTGVLATKGDIGVALPSLTTSQLYGGSGVAGVAQHFPAGTGVETALQAALDGTGGLASHAALLNTAGPIYNVLAYGADPTYATASDAAFTAAMTACTGAFPGNGTMYIPGGHYKLLSGFQWQRGCSIKADKQAHIEAGGAITDLMHGLTGASNSLQFLELSGGIWDCNNISTWGWQIPDFTELHLHDFFIENCAVPGAVSDNGAINLGANGALIQDNLYITNFSIYNYNVTINSYSKGIFTQYPAFGVPNSYFITGNIVGYAYPVYGSFSSGAFDAVHVWNYTSGAGITDGFTWTNYGLVTCIACEVDGPVTDAAWSVSGAGAVYKIKNSEFYNVGNDAVAYAIKIGSGAIVQANDNYFHGADVSHRVISDSTGDLTHYSGFNNILANYSGVTPTSTVAMTGWGTPNGSAVGSRGDVYFNRAGGNGAGAWIKETGDSTNTGWSAIGSFSTSAGTGTGPTLSGTCSSSFSSGGFTAGVIKATAGCAAGSYYTLSMPTSPAGNGWSCNMWDETTTAVRIGPASAGAASINMIVASGSASVVNNDLLSFNCHAY